MADDQPIILPPEPGPSWARPNWPIAELDEMNLGLDPTQATIEGFKKAAREQSAATGADPDMGPEFARERELPGGPADIERGRQHAGREPAARSGQLPRDDQQDGKQPGQQLPTELSQ